MKRGVAEPDSRVLELQGIPSNLGPALDTNLSLKVSRNNVKTVSGAERENVISYTGGRQGAYWS